MPTLLDSLCDIVAAIRGHSLPSDRGKIAEALTGDGLSTDTPKWMEDFVGAIAERQYTEQLFRIPAGYPDGENGLINSLMDIDQNVARLGIDDSGESVLWLIPNMNLLVYWSRESHGEGYDATIRPADADLNDWLKGQRHVK